ncbi:MAG: type II toxin-antitoxin system RelE/ParE family toxin [Pirellulaceae bacterium]|nr:type II toxin-antitoxin system RelE/ParE family toxin [Pirellulaceae bacterium]
MKPLFYSARARQDMRAILEHIAEHRPEAALRFTSRLEEHARILERFSEAGAAQPDLHPEIRVFPYRGYAVYYRVHDDRVTVERVLAPGIDVRPDLFDDGI